MFRTLSRSGLPYAIAGLRRQLLGVAHSVHLDFDTFEVIRLEGLNDEDGRLLVEQLARRQRLGLSEEVRDLMVQQFECSPFFISSFVQAAREEYLRSPATSIARDCTSMI
jgi:predicted ATPase